MDFYCLSCFAKIKHLCFLFLVTDLILGEKVFIGENKTCEVLKQIELYLQTAADLGALRRLGPEFHQVALFSAWRGSSKLFLIQTFQTTLAATAEPHQPSHEVRRSFFSTLCLLHQIQTQHLQLGES